MRHKVLLVSVYVALVVVVCGCEPGFFAAVCYLYSTQSGDTESPRAESPHPLQITTATLPDATEGVAYSYTLSASGGNSSNYNWSISGQLLWLFINSATGELSGCLLYTSPSPRD